MTANFDLNRFIVAQSTMYSTALEEIKAGRKQSHWMWYIFPQIHGLGYSATTMKFAIQSKAEALSYLRHPILGNRLIEITTAFYNVENKTAKEVLGSPDHLKFKSSMTLFHSIQNEHRIFGDVLTKYFEGKTCLHTIETLNSENG